MMKTKNTQPAGERTQSEVLRRIDQFFAPDIRVKLDENSRITSVEAVTRNGATFILKNETLGRNYDDVLFASGGLTFES